jgi:replicative DNA helicase/HKD family nuclease
VDYGLDGRDDHLLAWLRRELPSAVFVGLRTGFFTTGGLAGVEPDLEELVERGGRLEVLIGGNPLQYEVSALRALLGLSEDYPGRIEAFVVMAPDFLNAKTYLLQHGDGHYSAWVGSANLTNGGLGSNLETAVTFDSREDGEEVIARLREAHLTVVGSPTVRQLDERLLRQMQFGAQAARFGVGRTEVDLPEALEELMQGAVDKLDKVASHGLIGAGVTTGFEDLDAVLGCLIPGSLTVIASRPGVGRSTLALDMLRAAALRQKVPAAIFTFDMLKDEVVHRILSAEARIRLADMRAGRMTDDDWTRLARKMNEIAESSLFIEAGSAPDLDSLSTAVINSVIEHQLGLVVVDPLNAIVARSFADNREREVAEIARRLKALAMELEIPIVASADLGRQAEQRTDRRPLMGDLRDAGTIAQAADVVLLLNRPDYYERDDPRAGEADLIIAKNRHGPTSTVTVAHQLHYSRFSTLANPYSGAGG